MRAMKWRNRIAQGFSPGLAFGKIRPESTPNPSDAGCNSKLAQYSNTPSLRVAGFEDENEASHQSLLTSAQRPSVPPNTVAEPCGRHHPVEWFPSGRTRLLSESLSRPETPLRLGFRSRDPGK
jgi:hypothetical protein